MDSLRQFPDDKTYLKHEEVIKQYWKTQQIHKKVVKEASMFENEFIFVDGPPFASSNNLHSGHIAVGCEKDTMLRYKTMHEFKCTNKQGFDCHGVPSEGFAMKQLGLSSSKDIEDYGIDKFNGFCKQMINDCKDSWEPVFESIGRWVDFTDVYKTMDTNFMESVWWIFGQLYDKGLIYDGFKVLPYSTHCETPYSNFEAGLNYKTIVTQTLYVCFKVCSMENTYLVAWTTTPFTLPSNIALCVGPEIQYVICTDKNNSKYIIAESSVQNLKKEFVSVEKFKLGKEMVGMEYQSLFDFLTFKYHRVVSDSYVEDSSEIGTGIVHIAPSFGADDYRICLDNHVITPCQLSELDVINSKGNYLQFMGNYRGMYIFDAEKQIIKDLKNSGNIIRIQDYSHQYPFCYRSDTPLIYRAVSSFFVEVTKISNRMIELNEKIKWSKKEIGENRFKKWLTQAKDWSISRNRYFGTPIPVWRSDDKSETIVIRSIDELTKLAKLDYTLTDLHLESIGHITITSETSGKILKLDKGVFDCWFESGSVPYAQLHYPFENSTAFDDKDFLCDFVAEGLDQTRGWFYTMLVISTAISDKPPFRNVICSGIVLDENGEKISKSKGNFIDPLILINKYGADTLRLFFLKSPLLTAEPLLFKESDVKSQFQQMTPYYNVVKFFMEHYINSQKKENPIVIQYLMNDDDYDAGIFTLMDLWILEQVWILRTSVETHMNDYRIDLATKKVIDFVDNLANWYVKFNRDRLKGLHGSEASQLSMSVLFTVLFDYCVISAPFMPFLSEHVYSHLCQLMDDDIKIDSVHLELYPEVKRQHYMSQSFETLQKLSKMIRFLRDGSKSHTSVKTPIKKCTIYHTDQSYLNGIKTLVELIEDEVNCQNFEFVQIVETTQATQTGQATQAGQATNNLINYSVKPNYKLIGQHYKSLTKTIERTLKSLPNDTLKSLHNGLITSVKIDCADSSSIDSSSIDNSIDNNIDSSSTNKSFDLDKSFFDIIVTIKTDPSNSSDTFTQTQTKSIIDDGLVVTADLTYDEETHYMSQTKNLISFVQNCRKTMGLNPWNKINVEYSIDSGKFQFESMIEQYSTEISHKLGTKLTSLIALDQTTLDKTTTNSNQIFKFKIFDTNYDNDVIINVRQIFD